MTAFEIVATKLILLALFLFLLAFRDTYSADCDEIRIRPMTTFETVVTKIIILVLLMIALGWAGHLIRSM